MPHVYILQLKTGQYYIGSTTNLKQRLHQHKQGLSTYTSKFLPVKLVFSQKFSSYSQAYRAETWLKKLKNKNIINNIIASGKIRKVFSHFE